MGTGPFQHKQWIPNRYIQAVKNPKYWESGVPYLDGYKVVPVPDPAVRLQSFQAKEIDITRELNFKDYSSLEAQGKSGQIQFLRVPGARPTPIFFNIQKAPYDNVKVRQAFAYCIDKKAIVQAVLFGYGTEADTCLPPSSYYDAHYWPYTQDFKKAQSLLADAGLPNGLTSECIMIGEISDFPVAAQVLKSQLANAGITLNITLLDSATWFQRWQAGNYETNIVYWDGFIDPNDWLAVTNSIASTQNTAKYNNPQVETLFAQGIQETDPAKRQAIYFQMQKILNTDLPYIWLYSPDDVEVAQTYVHGHVLMNPALMPYPRYYRMWLDPPHGR